MSEEADLRFYKPTKRQIHGLKALSLCFERFEPLALTARVPTDELVDLGLAERNECHPRYKELGYQDELGYRLTSAGRTFLAAWRSR